MSTSSQSGDRRERARPFVEALPKRARRAWTMRKGPRAEVDVRSRTMVAPDGVEACAVCGAEHARAERVHALVRAAVGVPSIATMRRSHDERGYGPAPDAVYQAVADAFMGGMVGALYSDDDVDLSRDCPGTAAAMLQRSLSRGDLAGALAAAVEVGAGAASDSLAASTVEAVARAASMSPHVREALGQAAITAGRFISRRGRGCSRASTGDLDEAVRNTVPLHAEWAWSTLAEAVARAEADAATEAAREAAAAEARAAEARGVPTRPTMMGSRKGAATGEHGATGAPGGFPTFVGGGSREARWGKMVESIAEPMRRAPGMSARDIREADIGAVPMYPHRHADGRIWGVVRGAPAGTVLVDVSGSMSWSAEDLLSVVRGFPGATVALYSGGRPEPGSGRLVIVGRRGRLYEPKGGNLRHALDMGGLNVIDGPALRWLARQRRPRIWVSDGGVTDRNESMTEACVDDAADICAHGRIIRVDSADEALAVLAGAARPRKG